MNYFLVFDQNLIKELYDFRFLYDSQKQKIDTWFNFLSKCGIEIKF